MALFNYLSLIIRCPRCGAEAEMEAEFRFGLRELAHYRIGDQLRWDGIGVKTPAKRPDQGNYDGEAYVVCPLCKRDFWLVVSVQEDVIVSAAVDSTKQPYIANAEVEPPALDPIVETQWDPRAHAEQMRKRTSPPVSAFFLIDSQESIQKCIRWLSNLKPYNMPDMTDSQYFDDVRTIFESGREVINFDFDFSLLWQKKPYAEKLRCHYVDKGQYEIELWLPGVVADEIADKFSDGHAGFFCAFMSHAFYD
jgi:hypothetical protein